MEKMVFFSMFIVNYILSDVKKYLVCSGVCITIISAPMRCGINYLHN